VSSLPNWHPFLVHFPVALYSTAWVCDAALCARFRRGWLDRAVVLMYAIAAVGSGFAALTGKLAADALAEGLATDVNEAVAVHGDWAFFTVVSMWVVAGLRVDVSWRDRTEPRPTLRQMRLAALLVSTAALAVLLSTAIRGGELVYRFGVAVQTVK
jgi:uncharacterized membrane protein